MQNRGLINVVLLPKHKAWARACFNLGVEIPGNNVLLLPKFPEKLLYIWLPSFLICITSSMQGDIDPYFCSFNSIF